MKYVLAILALGILIIVHELGHFIMAKINKVKVNEFSIGMGPKIFTYEGKETKYSLSLFPVGGYVEMLGAQEDVEDDKSFSSKSPLRRISIIIAGVFMNFILAICIFTAVICHGGYVETNISEVSVGSPLAEAGVKNGSIIKEINGQNIYTYYDISLNEDITRGKDLTIKYEYKGQVKETKITPEYLEDEKRYIMGATFEVNKAPSLIEGVKQSFKQTATLVTQTVKTLKNLVIGKGNFKTDIGGPVSVVKLSADAAQSGMWDLVNLVGLMSISLAVFNLIPIPALDGGWTILLLIELITRRKLPDKVIGVLNGVFFILLMVLMVAVTIKDILFPVSY